MTVHVPNRADLITRFKTLVFPVSGERLGDKDRIDQFVRAGLALLEYFEAGGNGGNGPAPVPSGTTYEKARVCALEDLLYEVVLQSDGGNNPVLREGWYREVKGALGGHKPDPHAGMKPIVLDGGKA